MSSQSSDRRTSRLQAANTQVNCSPTQGQVQAVEGKVIVASDDAISSSDELFYVVPSRRRFGPYPGGY